MISNILETQQKNRHNSLPSFMIVDRFQGIILEISGLNSQILLEVLTRSHTSLVGMNFFPGVRIIIIAITKTVQNNEKKVYYSLPEIGGLNVNQKFIPPLHQESWNFAVFLHCHCKSYTKTCNTKTSQNFKLLGSSLYVLHLLRRLAQFLVWFLVV